MLKVLLDQCLELFYHLLLSFRLGSLEILLQGGVLLVTVKTVLVFTVKLEHVIT